MPTTETFSDVTVSPPSSLRTELNLVAAAVAVGICLVILALLGNATPRPAAHHARGHAPAAHARVTDRPGA
jgi:hypothetical protein